jgi:hypothetical protein
MPDEEETAEEDEEPDPLGLADVDREIRQVRIAAEARAFDEELAARSPAR